MRFQLQVFELYLQFNRDAPVPLRKPPFIHIEWRGCPRCERQNQASRCGKVSSGDHMGIQVVHIIHTVERLKLEVLLKKTLRSPEVTMIP